MTRATFTPGPWHVFRDEVNNADGMTVARVVQFVPAYRAGSDANARLIAAAPKMLAALEEARTAVERFAVEEARANKARPLGASWLWRDRLARLDAARAEATGGEQ